MPLHPDEARAGIGRLRYPHVTAEEVPLDRRRLAVSVDADLKYEESGYKGNPAGLLGKFLAAWGDKDGQPDFVRQASDVGPSWSLTLRPHESGRAVQQTLFADFGPRRAEVTFEANLTCTGAPSASKFIFNPRAAHDR